MNIVETRNVTRSFAMPAGPVVAVRDVTISIAPGEHTAISGPSGCGKSTLLHILGCVDTPSSGTLIFDGNDASTLNDRARSLLRLRHVGFVFQRFFLLPMLTAAENVELPQAEAGAPRDERRRRSLELLDYVGLAGRADHRPSQLSGGEMQRVAIARALANRPRLLLADEPTGELDGATGEHVASLLDRVNADGTALVIVTHYSALAGRARRVLTMRDGRVEQGGDPVIGRLALRSLTAHPVRSAVLAAGFGVGVAVMAILLGVAQVVLEQSRAPALVGGGDVLIRLSPEVPARLVLAGSLQADAIRSRFTTAAPTHTTRLYLRHDGRSTRVSARGGIPSLERALGDNETAGIPSWRDSPDDIAWTQDTPEKVLRYIDRFHAIPDAPTWGASWAEWLYFNGRASGARFYLTFLVGPSMNDGRRNAGVRLQLDRDGRVETFTARVPITEADAQSAPDLTIGENAVRLEGMTYRIHLDLRDEDGRQVRGDLTIEASPGRLVPPLEITGALGWRSGYVVPVMSGRLAGVLDVGDERLSFEGGTGYHDHNWGFWQGVSWQWGQVQQGDLSLLYGRVFPPSEAADPDRVPGFVGVLGPDGPLGYATDVTITEHNDASGRPQAIAVRARGANLDVQLRFDIESAVTTRASGSSSGSGPLGSGLDFLQLRGNYTVTGRAGGRTLKFTAAGSAETFRGSPSAR